jgi:hypothetical protein
MPLFYHKYVNYVLAHSVNYVITLYNPCLPSKKGRWLDGIAKPLFCIIFIL